MCVILIIKSGQDIPEKKVLQAMHKANPHGMGFVSRSMHYNGMSFETFYQRLMFVPKNENIIVHFRYATHGSICAKNCHPFHKGRIWFAHNGILDIKPRGDMTDSETAFRDILYPAMREYGLGSDEFDAIVDDIRGSSKFAFMDKDGNVLTYGSYMDYQGYMVSNLNWTRYIAATPRYAWYHYC